jgi:hypothetical protein
MKRTTLIICLAAIMLLALAVPAFAGNPDGSSGSVYGKAVLAPYAITISGGGTDPDSPLTYQGTLNQGVPEEFGSQVTVQNNGTELSEIKIDQNQAPTAGADTWTLTSSRENDNSCGWVFISPDNQRGTYVMSPSDRDYDVFSVMNPGLAAGNSATYSSMFFFPTVSGSTADHYMSATISAVAPIN